VDTAPARSCPRRSVPDGQELLLNHSDTSIKRLFGADKRYRPTIQEHFTLVCTVNAKYTLHQRGFPGSILAHDRVNRSWSNRERNIVKSFHTRKFLGNVPHLQNIFIIAHRESPSGM